MHRRPDTYSSGTRTTPIEAAHSKLKARLHPMRGLKRLRSARIIAARHASVQHLRGGHYDSVAEDRLVDRARVAFDELALSI